MTSEPVISIVPETETSELKSPAYTDLANGEYFAWYNRDHLRYLDDRDVWLQWDSKRWANATKKYVLKRAALTAKKMLSQANKASADIQKTMVEWAKKSAELKRLNAMITIGASDDRIRIKMSQMNQHPDWLNARNCTINLQTGETWEHRREDLLTTLTDIDYDPTATAPRWEKFLEEIFAEDKDLIAFIHRATGYTLTGHTREQCFFLLWGETGNNGKGRFIRQLRRLLGDASKTIPFATLIAKRAQTDNTPVMATLAGARLVAAGESDEGIRFSEATIKEITGEDEITVCAKYEMPFSYTPAFKAWLHCNHKPVIRGTDNAIWRRPKLIPFTVSFEGRADKTLDKTLDEQASGILAWVVRGSHIWYESGLESCTTVDEAKESYRTECDSFSRFFEDEVVVLDPSDDKYNKSFLTSSTVYLKYAQWCENNGEKNPLDSAILNKRLVTKGAKVTAKHAGRGLLGIIWKSNTPDPALSFPAVPSHSNSQPPQAQQEQDALTYISRMLVN